VSVKTLDLPGLHPFLTDPLDCAFGNGQISSRDFGGVSVVLLVEGIHSIQQPVDQSLMDEVTHLCLLQLFGEFQVQIIDLYVQACLLHKNSNIHHL
jgi:hypothetical protein